MQSFNSSRNCFSFLCLCHFMLEMLSPISGARYNAPLGVR